MEYLSIWFLLMGFFFSNGMPHFLFGAAGKRFISPLGMNSSATVNTVWGLINFVLGTGILIWKVPGSAPTVIDVINFLVGYWLIVVSFGLLMDRFKGDDF